LGIETVGEVTTKLIEKNTTIPTKKSQVFSTAIDNQNAVTIKVLQGEREMAADNKLLGNFNLEGIAPAPRGVPQIEVTFDIDANGIVNVSAKDKGTGKEQKITIQASGGLSDTEIDQMVKDAEANKDADKKKRETVDAKNMGEQVAHQAEKSVKEHGDKVTPEEKALIETKIKELRDTLKDGNMETITAKVKELNEAQMKLGEAIYKAEQESAKEEPKKEAGTGDNADVVDADYEEVEKGK
jgi:molecular chaperone DnaK